MPGRVFPPLTCWQLHSIEKFVVAVAVAVVVVEGEKEDEEEEEKMTLQDSGCVVEHRKQRNVVQPFLKQVIWVDYLLMGSNRQTPSCH